MKGISTVVFLVMLLIIIMSVLVPAFIIFNSQPVYSDQGDVQRILYNQLQCYQKQKVYRGEPNIYYNASPSDPSLDFLFTTTSSPFNITQIYYFNGNTWCPLLNNFIVIAGDTNIQLPSKVSSSPILILTGEANFFFLNPNTSVNTITVSGPTGKIPVYVTAFALNGTKTIPLSLKVTLQGVCCTLTPKIFYLNPGTYTISDDNSSIIFLSSYGLTAVFQNWTMVGQGSVSTPNEPTTQVTITGPTVLTIIYKAYTQTYQVIVKPDGIPLGYISRFCNNAFITPCNHSIPVIIDDKEYVIGCCGITLTLTYGYHIVEFPAYYNVTFCYTGGHITKMKGGQINCYILEGLESSTPKIKVICKYEIFVNGSGIVYGYFNKYSTYYLVCIKNDFYFPSNIKLISNSTPACGDIAAQLYCVHVSTTGQNMVLGPTKNFVPEKIYFKAGTSLQKRTFYITCIQGKFKLLVNGKIRYYKALQSFKTHASYTSFSVYCSYCPSYITVCSPIKLIIYEEWCYGARC